MKKIVLLNYFGLVKFLNILFKVTIYLGIMIVINYFGYISLFYLKLIMTNKYKHYNKYVS